MKATDKTNTCEINESGISEFTISFYTKCEKISYVQISGHSFWSSKHQILIGHPPPAQILKRQSFRDLPQ